MTLTELRKKYPGWEIWAGDYGSGGPPAWGADASFTDYRNLADRSVYHKCDIGTRIDFATRKEAVAALAKIMEDEVDA